MLANLKINNFALIEAANLDFAKGLTVITGETGSGKSILLGALNLILGERADFSVIRFADQKTVVEAEFNLSGFQLGNFFETHDLDFSDETVVRREISSQGKSRSFINDTPVSLTVLKEFTENLVHIHSQHHTLALKNKQFQLEFFDVLAAAEMEKSNYKTSFLQLKKKKIHLAHKREALKKSIQESDYNQFQLDELTQLNLHQKHYASLESELNAIENSGDIKQSFALALQYLNEERGVSELLSHLKSSLEKTKQLHPLLAKLSDRVQSTLIEVKDIIEEAENGLESFELDPSKLAELSELMDVYNRALIKHQVTSQEDLIAVFQTLERSENDLASLEEEVRILETEIEALEQQVFAQAELLQVKRNQASPIISDQLVKLLDQLKLPNSTVNFVWETLDKLDENGNASLSLFFSPNQGLAPKLIEKSASGGELSRFMLAIQMMMSEKKQLPTLIFDEIDTGVSGEVASKIGALLKNMGNFMQVMTITHLPQVAAKGNNHLKVQKANVDGITTTEIVTLTEPQAVEEIARLMSGENINAAALENAKALMK